MTYLIFIFLSTGLISGFIAGLLGVGGGIIIVPITYFILINLGYSQLDASQVIAKIINSSEDELNIEDIIRLSLKTLVSKG